MEDVKSCGKADPQHTKIAIQPAISIFLDYLDQRYFARVHDWILEMVGLLRTN